MSLKKCPLKRYARLNVTGLSSRHGLDINRGHDSGQYRREIRTRGREYIIDVMTLKTG